MDDHLHLIEFAYENRYHSFVSIDPFDVLYGRKCRSPPCLLGVYEIALICPEKVYEDNKKV